MGVRPISNFWSNAKSGSCQDHALRRSMLYRARSCGALACSTSRNEDQRAILDTWFQKYKYRVKLVELEEKPEPLFLNYLKDIKSLEYDTADDDLEVSLRLHFSLVLADEFLKVYEKIGMVIDAGLTEEQQQNSIKYFEQTVDQMVDNSVYCIKGFTDIITEAIQKVFPKNN